MNSHFPPRRWDIFCQVIDNFGDVGVCWRLAADLGARGHVVRLFIDDASALQWMAPEGAPGVTVLPWPAQAPEGGPGDVIVEAFGCELPESFIAAIAHQSQSQPGSVVWINLEYLSAESYVERCHRLPSPIMSGPAAGLTRWFFYPGFTESTGGLLREPNLEARQAAFDRPAWRTRHGLSERDDAFLLFCYEPPAFQQVFTETRHSAQWLVTPGRAAGTVRAALTPPFPGNVQFLPPVSQSDFDETLWGCDLNFVRGEDSLVRAIWAGEAFVWQIYPQHDDAHHEKLDAFLDWMQAPASLRAMHAVWNGIPDAVRLPTLNKEILAEWRACTRAARQRLLEQKGLVAQLLGFVAEKS